LGLAIVKQLVDLQKGKISLESHPEKGTEFRVELDYKLPDMDKLFQEAMAAESEPVSLQKIKALIAEDNLMNQHLIAHLMKSWSIDFKIVHNGAEAIEELKKDHYSIILMDIQMPEMDGYTATGIIRHELKNEIPIIAMTAHAMMGEKEKCMNLGMNDYVSKPIKETVLYNIIARHAQQSAEWHQPSYQHINLEYLHELSGNDAGFESQLLQQFIQQVPLELEQLKNAIVEKDYNAAKNVAHSMKSTIGYVGMSEDLHPALDRIEQNTKQEENSHLWEEYCYIESKCHSAIEEVKDFFEKS
ncbi:MAG: response regulator, partial [Flavisolibacter sp.]|nr:response regulator [Flavisolibacter sp.]